jgi:hypothetical protein
MTMIRNLMFGISLLALSGASAIAAPAVKTHHSTTRVVAQAPAGDTAAPADKAADKSVKKEKKAKAKKGDATKTDGAKEMKAAPEKTPAPATK